MRFSQSSLERPNPKSNVSSPPTFTFVLVKLSKSSSNKLLTNLMDSGTAGDREKGPDFSPHGLIKPLGASAKYLYSS